MRGFLAVARREVVENRMAFLAALIAGMGPLAVPFVQNLHGAAAREAWSLGALFGAVALAGGLSIALGISTLSRGISNRQISFFFARPLSSLTIWAGKLTGVAALALAAALLETLPSLLVSGGHLQMPFGWSLWPLLGLSLLLVPLSHAVGVALRSRTPWLALDLGLLVVTALIVGISTRALMREQAAGVLTQGLSGLAIVVLAAFFAAGFAAVSIGRTDIRRAHRALSATLWPIVGVGVLGLAGYSSWALSAAPRDLAEVWDAIPAQRGSWVVAGGPARGAQPVFLLDTATGRSVRSGADWRQPVVSADGAHAAWFEPAGRPLPFDVMTLALNDPSARPVRAKLSLPGTGPAMLSSDGTRLAVFQRGVLSIYDLGSGEALGSARVSEPRVRHRGFFVGPDRFRVLQLNDAGSSPDSRQLEILEFDAASKRLSRTGTIEELHAGVFVSASSSGDRILLRESGGTRITLHDGRGGALLATLREGPALESSFVGFVADGRIVLGLSDGAHAQLQVFSPQGQLQKKLDLPQAGRLSLGGEASNGILIIGAGGKSEERASRTIYLADLGKGQIRRVADRLYPVVSIAVLVSPEPNYAPAPGSEATRLFYGPGRSLVELDPQSGKRRVILGGDGAR